MAVPNPQSLTMRFDEMPVSSATLDDLKESPWRRFEIRQTSADAREVFLSKLSMARQDVDGTLRPTAAGVLLASAEPRRFLPNAFIQAVAYRDAKPSQPGTAPYRLDGVDISGRLDEQIGEALRFVFRNMRTAAIRMLGRHDIPQFDLNAVFEALVNAVAHRDYSIYGAKIRLRVWADRLELFSPGGLPNTMTVESLILRQASRNEVITSLLARCPIPEYPFPLRTARTTMMDKRGDGVRIIVEASEALALHPPEYRVLDATNCSSRSPRPIRTRSRRRCAKAKRY